MDQAIDDFVEDGDSGEHPSADGTMSMRVPARLGGLMLREVAFAILGEKRE